MSLFIGVISQKGGVGKSSLAKLIAVEYARAGGKALIADMDLSQTTCLRWHQKRVTNKISPEIDVGSFDNLSQVLNKSKSYDIIVFDGAPHATRMTKEIAQIAHLLVLPVGNSIEDLEPQVDLAHELVEASIAKAKIRFVLTRVGTSKSERNDVLDYLEQAGYKVIQESIPEKTIFRRVAIEGRTLTETPYKTLNQCCEKVIQQIINTLI